jgi:hypothetical protein
MNSDACDHGSLDKHVVNKDPAVEAQKVLNLFGKFEKTNLYENATCAGPYDASQVLIKEWQAVVANGKDYARKVEDAAATISQNSQNPFVPNVEVKHADEHDSPAGGHFSMESSLLTDVASGGLHTRKVVLRDNGQANAFPTWGYPTENHQLDHWHTAASQGRDDDRRDVPVDINEHWLEDGALPENGVWDRHVYVDRLLID